jgi:antitoxin component YwqK of YwqJK toxin-antitoxin module
MKKLLVLLFITLTLLIQGCGFFEETVCVKTDAQYRDGLTYLPNKTKPFTGKNLCKYRNGQIYSEGKYKDGKRYGNWTFWEENGKIKYKFYCSSNSDYFMC